MSDLTDQTDSLIHYKHLSWPGKLAESKTALAWLLVIVILSVCAGWVGGFLGPAIFHTIGMGWVFPVGFLAGLLIGSVVLFGARFSDRHLFGAVKASMAVLEDRLMDGTSQSPAEDLEKLVAGSLKLKRMAAADIYSQRLLAISGSSSHDLAKISDWVVTTECWASTGDYHKGWKYKLVWLYETRGVLTLSPDSLDFQSKKFTFQCHPSRITSVKLKRHPLWMKPIPLKFISITIEESGCEHTFDITPSFGHTDTIWDCNRMVSTWMQRLEKVRSSG